MRQVQLIVLLAAGTFAAGAQTSPQQAPPAIPPNAATGQAPTAAPSGPPPVSAPEKTLFTISLRYQDIKIGDGPVIELDSLTKFYGVYYTEWRAADGVKVDSTYDHPRPPLFDKDGKRVLDAEGKPVPGPPQPMPFSHGLGINIMGFHEGFAGMRVGGKRRLFIPWQLGFGARIMPPARIGLPEIPARSDLIFDVELVDLSDLAAKPAGPAQPQTQPK
jgi:peptidylprolyl isomerase